MTTTDSASRLEARVEELSRTVDGLAARVQSLEKELYGEGAVREAGVGAGAAPFEALEAVDAIEGGIPAEAGAVLEQPAGVSGWGALALVGRTLMVLGGAYLFRALTEAGTVPAHVGLLLGLAYAFVWLFFADRAAAAGRSRSAAFHGASFALIAEPLAWEAAGRFGAVGATGGALGVVIFTACALAVAWWRSLRAVAWIAVLGAIFSAWALMASIEPILPGVAVLVVVAVAADWLGLLRRWRALPWVAAVTADLTLAVLAVDAAFGRLEVLTAQRHLLWILVALFVLSAGGTVARAMFVERWRPRWFDLAQVPASVVIGYGGGWLMVRALVQSDLADPGLGLALGLASLVAAAGCYGLAVPLLKRRPERRPAYLLTSSLGLVATVGGCGLVLGSAGQAAVWSVLAVVGAWVSGRLRTVTLGLQAFLFAVLAAVASGLLVDAGVAFVSRPSAEWPVVSPVAIAVLVALAVAASLRLPADSPFWGKAARVPKFLLLGAFVWVAVGVALVVVLPWVAGGENGAALVAAVRTGFVALVALVLAWASRFERYREARWLVYVVLAAGAVKLLGEDLRLGRAGELFVALAVYGGALILAPRLARGGGRAEEGETEAEA